MLLQMALPHSLSVHLSVDRLFPRLSYCEQCCPEHRVPVVFLNCSFVDTDPEVGLLDHMATVFSLLRTSMPGSKYSSTSGLSPRGHLERQAEFHASTQDEA